MDSIKVLVARAYSELRSSYRNGNTCVPLFRNNCPPYTQQYSSLKLSVVRNWEGLL